jgi:lipopolysaccharide export system protein LptA
VKILAQTKNGQKICLCYSKSSLVFIRLTDSSQSIHRSILESTSAMIKVPAWQFIVLVTTLVVASTIAPLALQLNAATAAAPPTTLKARGNDILINAEEQTYDVAKSLTTFRRNVVVTTKSGVIRAPYGEVTLDANNSPKKAFFKGGVTLVRTSDRLNAPTMTFDFGTEEFSADGGVQTQVESPSQGTINITSTRQQFSQTRKQMLATGNVRVLMKDSTATSNQTLLQLGADDSVEKVLFLGNAHVVQSKTDVRGNSITLLPKQDLFIAEGQVASLLSSEGNSTPVLLRSHFQQLDKKANLMVASGHVDLDYENYRAKGPKATFYLAPAGGSGSLTVKRALFTGRSTITEKARQVTADVIEITNEPRHFDARGNVKTKLISEQKSSPANTTTTSSGKKQKKKATPAVSDSGKLSGSKPASSVAKAEEDEFNPNAFNQ